MKSRTLGTGTSDAEVTNIDSHGFWLLVRGTEHFLSYEDHPWFKDARVADILDVELLHDIHLHWPVLDVDLTIESLENPSQFPLTAK